MRFDRILVKAMPAITLLALAGIASSAEPSLVPTTASTAPDYFCTWNSQGYAASYTSTNPLLRPADVQADAMVEGSLFGKGPSQNWAEFFPEARADLIFLLDDAPDFPIGGGHNHPMRGSLELDPGRFPSYQGTPVERLTKLNGALRARGWRSLGLWICNSRPRTPEGMNIDNDTYWSERMAWCEKAGVTYWKVDWGIGPEPIWKWKLTERGRATAPNIWIESSGLNSLVNNMDVFRTYDVALKIAIPVTIKRSADYLRFRRPDGTSRGLLNVEDEVYIGAGLGAVYGVMRHPMAGNMPNGSSDSWFPSNFRDVKRRMDEVTRAVRWHRIALPFDFGDMVAVDSRTLADLSTEPAPARIARGGLPLPAVNLAAGQEPPYVLCSRHPEGELAIATQPRRLQVNGKDSLVFPLADITLDVGALSGPLGVFGRYGSLTLVTTSALAGKRILAQDLAGQTPVDITMEVQVGNGRLTIPGAVLHRVGLMAAKAGDVSDPGLVLIVEGLTRTVAKQAMRPAKWGAYPVYPPVSLGGQPGRGPSRSSWRGMGRMSGASDRLFHWGTTHPGNPRIFTLQGRLVHEFKGR